MSGLIPTVTDSVDRESRLAKITLPVPGTLGPPPSTCFNSAALHLPQADPPAGGDTVALGVPTPADDLGAALAVWPELAALRTAASAARPARFRLAIATMASSARICFAAALVAWAQPELGPLSAPVASAQLFYQVLRNHVVRNLPSLTVAWHLQPEQAWLIHRGATALVGTPDASRPDGAKPPRADARGFRLSHYLAAGNCLPSINEQAGNHFEHRIPCFFTALSAGWDLAFALRAWGLLRPGVYSADGRCFFADQQLDYTARAKDQVPYQLAGVEDDASDAYLVICDRRGISHIVARRDMAQRRALLLAQAAAAGGQSNFFPACFRLQPDPDSHCVVLPRQTVMSLYDARENWELIMKGVIDATTSAIVNGLLVMPLRSWPSRCIHKQNHASWEDDPAAQEALGPTIAKWLATGVLEFVGPGCPMPLIVEPCGAVDKATAPLFRLITDGREGNGNYLPWGVRYHTTRDVALVLRPYDFFWCADISDAYHTTPYAGCGQGIVEGDAPWPSAGSGRSSRRQRFIGCSPQSCTGACDKCFSGIMLFWCVFRFACCQFGKATAHGPLNSYIQCLIRYFANLSPPTSLQAWVDDLLGSVRAAPHAHCEGLEGGCATCAENFRTACLAYDHFCAICRQLNIFFSAGKGFRPRQLGDYTGIFMDTVKGRFTVSPEKLLGVHDCLLALLASGVATRKAIASGHGKASHYAQAIPYLSQALPEFSRAMTAGAVGQIRWGESVPLAPRFHAALDYALHTVRDWGRVGRPMWPLPASSVYNLFLSGGTNDLRVATIVWDAGPDGWGAVIRTTASQPGTLIIGTFDVEDGEHMQFQVRRETRGGVLAFRAALEQFDLRGWTIVLRNDAVGALSALSKGCAKSDFLQDQAMAFVALARRAAVETLFVHAPGEALIREGIDGASRDGVASVRGPTIDRFIRRAIDELALGLNWRLSVDLFATRVNRQTPRFFARYAEPGAEGVDAFEQSDWGCSLCPACRQRHREVFYAFPPQALIPAFIRKADADRARGILLVPHSITAAYWSRLCTASLTDGGPWRSITDPGSHLAFAGAFRPQALAIFALDFQSHARGTDLPFCTPCGQEQAARPHISWQSPADLSDRRRIDEALRLAVSRHATDAAITAQEPRAA